MVPPGAFVSVEDFAQPFLHVPDNQMGEDATAVLCDPQTSGGMLCAIPSEAAATFEEEFAARCGRTPAKNWPRDRRRIGAHSRSGIMFAYKNFVIYAAKENYGNRKEPQ